MKCSWSQQAAQSIGKTLRSRVQGPPIKQQRTARARFRTFYTMQANVEIYKWSWVYLLLITCDRIRIRAITHRQKKGLDLKAFPGVLCSKRLLCTNCVTFLDGHLQLTLTPDTEASACTILIIPKQPKQIVRNTFIREIWASLNISMLGPGLFVWHWFTHSAIRCSSKRSKITLRTCLCALWTSLSLTS